MGFISCLDVRAGRKEETSLVSKQQMTQQKTQVTLCDELGYPSCHASCGTYMKITNILRRIKFQTKKQTNTKTKTKQKKQQQQQQITKNNPKSFPSPKNHNSTTLPSEHFGCVYYGNCSNMAVLRFLTSKDDEDARKCDPFAIG